MNMNDSTFHRGAAAARARGQARGRAGALRSLRGWAALAALMLAASAQAHDTWLVPAADAAGAAGAARDESRFELATGNRFPTAEVATDPASIIGAQCADAEGRRSRMRALRTEPKWTLMSHRPGWNGGAAVACWFELKAHEVEVEPNLIPTYFNEIRAPQSLRDAWAAMQARGLPWRETYRKYARMELATPREGRAPAAGERERLRQPVGHALEIVVLGDAAVAVGADTRFAVLRDGKPLAGFPVEFVNDQNPIGVWTQSDANGQLSLRMPFAGRWLLRGTDLRLDERDPARWQSRFVTLMVEVR